MAENVPPVAAVPNVPPIAAVYTVPSGEIGRHGAFTNKDISNVAEPCYADGLNCDSLMGKATVVMTIDPNTAVLERVLTNAPELDIMVQRLMLQLDVEDSALRRACDEIVGRRPAVVERVTRLSEPYVGFYFASPSFFWV